jgi:Dos2-interacting transcription regulator of RNA-Pol-II
MGPEFLTGYINLAENEKDPRNLLIAFAIDRVILIEFDISHHVEVGAIFLVKYKDRHYNEYHRLCLISPSVIFQLHSDRHLKIRAESLRKASRLRLGEFYAFYHPTEC